MMKANPTPQGIKQGQRWRMPILPESYADRHPALTEEEKLFIHKYLTASRSYLAYWTKSWLEKLTRFETPFLDTVRLLSDSNYSLVAGRRHLFRYLIQTEKAFWAWPKETWIEVIQAAPQGHTAGGTRYWMVALAYLFCDFLYAGSFVPYGKLAEAIFGTDIVETELNKLYASLIDIGYFEEPNGRQRLQWLYGLVTLTNRSPYAENVSASALVAVNELLASMPGAVGIRGRQMLTRLQTALCHLDILDEPVVLVVKNESVCPPVLKAHNPALEDPLWLAWVRAFYEQTPHQNKKTLRGVCYNLLTAGRWLRKTHPEICEPHQWDEHLAEEYVTYTCLALRGDHILPSNTRRVQFQEMPQKLSPTAINHRLQAMRSFFSNLQLRGYTVNGKYYPKLQLTWLPHVVFKTPADVRAACQPDPKDIQEDAWFKLIWAACTLTKEKLDALNRKRPYPLAYYRAICLIWVTAARRSDEIRRLQVGCVRREWVPEMRDEQGNQIEPEAELAYIRIPTNKMRGAFYVPVPLYVADAVEVWESMRPPNQKVLIDRKTHQPTHYLFQYRNELIGAKFLNRTAIPLLCQIAGINQVDIVGRITSHRARATTATLLRKMGMSPADIGKLLGHTNPTKSLPWYLREDKHHLGRAYRKANPLERYVAAILDTNAHARQEPCVFYYLSDGPDGRPRMCGNPHFSRCIHQLMCIECEAFIDHEQAEAIEKREGAIVISVPIPLPPQMVAELNEQDEAGSDARLKLETLPPPTLPGPAFHFNKKVPLRSAPNAAEDLQARLVLVEAQIAKKRGRTDRRSASLQALLKERAELQARLAAQEKGP